MNTKTNIKAGSMNFWRRSIRHVRPVHRDPTRSWRAPSRSCRFQLEDLEGRALLSTYQLSEYILGTGRHVDVNVDGVVSDHVFHGSPLPTFVLNTGGQFNTIEILDTRAGVPIQVNTANHDLVNVGNAGSVQGILAPVTITGPTSGNEVEIDDSADPAARTATLSTSTIGGMSWGNLSGLAPAGISFQYADTSRVFILTGTGPDTVDVEGTGVTTYIIRRRLRHGQRGQCRQRPGYPGLPLHHQLDPRQYDQHRRLGRPRGPDGHAQHPQ